jgi:aryl-alcohol dehydrogenase-like predicted oxidoreductase
MRGMIDRIALGRTGIEVPRICLGTMTFGQQNTEDEAHSQLDFALAHGIDFVDTAEMYPIPVKADTYGTTERIVGTWLARGPRDRVTLAGKVAGPGRGMTWMRDGPRAGLGELSKRDILLACDASLQRLRTDHIDLYQIHWPARNVPTFGARRFDAEKDFECASVHEQLEAMSVLVRDGKVRAIGVSNETPWGVCEFTRVAGQFGLPRIATIQNVYNLLSREFDVALAETCHREQVSMLAYSPLAFGHLSGKYSSGALPHGARMTLFGDHWPRYRKPQIAEAVAMYRAIAERIGVTPTELALSFAYRTPGVASTIVGATAIVQLEQAVAAWNVRLDDEALAAIDAVHERVTNPAR